MGITDSLTPEENIILIEFQDGPMLFETWATENEVVIGILQHAVENNMEFKPSTTEQGRAPISGFKEILDNPMFSRNGLLDQFKGFLQNKDQGIYQVLRLQRNDESIEMINDLVTLKYELTAEMEAETQEIIDRFLNKTK